MADRIQQRRDTAANWQAYNPILLEGEVGYVTDNPNQYKIGDGVRAWNSLPFRGFDGTIVQELGKSETSVMSQKAVTRELVPFMINSGIPEDKKYLFKLFIDDIYIENAVIDNQYMRIGYFGVNSNIFGGLGTFGIQLQYLKNDDKEVSSPSNYNSLIKNLKAGKYSELISRDGVMNGVKVFIKPAIDFSFNDEKEYFWACDTVLNIKTYNTDVNPDVVELCNSVEKSSNSYTDDKISTNNEISPFLNREFITDIGLTPSAIESGVIRINNGIKSPLNSSWNGCNLGIIVSSNNITGELYTDKISYFEIVHLITPSFDAIDFNYGVLLQIKSKDKIYNFQSSSNDIDLRKEKLSDGRLLISASLNIERSIPDKISSIGLYLIILDSKTSVIDRTLISDNINNYCKIGLRKPYGTGNDLLIRKFLKTQSKENDKYLTIYNYQISWNQWLIPGVITHPNGRGVIITKGTVPTSMWFGASFKGGFVKGRPIKIRGYFKTTIEIPLTYYIFTHDEDGTRNIHYAKVTKVDGETGIYFFEKEFPTTKTSTNSFEISFQNTVEIPKVTKQEECYFDQVCYYQDFVSDWNFPKGYTNTVLDKIVKELTEETIKNTEIIVSSDDYDEEADFKGKNAIQLALNSINDASNKNRYKIFVKNGLYKITNSSEYLGYPGYPCMVCPINFVDIIGQSKENCIVWAELPYDDANIDTTISRNSHQTVYNWANDCIIENITFIAKNIRYVLHQDSPKEALKTRKYKNVDFRYYGDKGSIKCFGIGTWSGSKTYVETGKCRCSISPAAFHNQAVQMKESLWSFKNYEFTADIQSTFMNLQNSGSMLCDKFELIGCSFGSQFILEYIDWWIYRPGLNDSFNHSEWRITGFDNKPFYFYNSVNGPSLRVTSKSMGKDSKVRFSTSGKAYEALIENPHTNYGNLGHPLRKIIDKYVVFDGTIGLSGYANGAVCIRETPYIFGVNVSEDSMGKRLGDCSSVNKVLNIIIDEVSYDVNFNKNYTEIPNSDILFEINSIINSSGIASIEDIGKDYYPEMSDVLSICTNKSNTDPILKGTVVRLINGSIEPCPENGKVYGVAIDDIPPYYKIGEGVSTGYGRVVMKAYMPMTVGNDRHSVKVSEISDSNYKVSNGILVPDNNGEFRTIAPNIIGIIP